jgi:hypothetical protein
MFSPFPLRTWPLCLVLVIVLGWPYFVWSGGEAARATVLWCLFLSLSVIAIRILVVRSKRHVRR